MDPSGFGENWSVSLKSLKKIYRLMKSFSFLAIWNASCTWSSKFWERFQTQKSDNYLLISISKVLVSKYFPGLLCKTFLNNNCIFLADLNLFHVCHFKSEKSFLFLLFKLTIFKALSCRLQLSKWFVKVYTTNRRCWRNVGTYFCARGGVQRKLLFSPTSLWETSCMCLYSQKIHSNLTTF